MKNNQTRFLNVRLFRMLGIPARACKMLRNLQNLFSLEIISNISLEGIDPAGALPPLPYISHLLSYTQHFFTFLRIQTLNESLQ